MFENEITKKRKRPGILQYGIANDIQCYIKIIRLYLIDLILPFKFAVLREGNDIGMPNNLDIK